MKRFTLKFLIVLIPLYLVVFYYVFYVVPNISGDLGYLGKIPFGKEYMITPKTNVLKYFHVNTFCNSNLNTHFQIATSGDSFSQQEICGYQNYLSNFENRNILNFKRNDDSNLSPEQISLNHLIAGDFRRLKIKIIIVESVERSFIYSLNNLKFDSIVSEPKIPLEKVKKSSWLEKVSEWIRLSIFDGDDNFVKKVNLNNYYFDDIKRGNKLYFYKDDLLFTDVTVNEIKQAKVNLIILKRLFESAGIKFIYLVPADKYNVYQSFAFNNPYPENRIMEHFKDFEKTEFFINTNNLLIPMVKNGIKDVYLMNDSHWSYKGSEAVAKELHRRIKLLEINDLK
jgi:hypothetical protein